MEQTCPGKKRESPPRKGGRGRETPYTRKEGEGRHASTPPLRGRKRGEEGRQLFLGTRKREALGFALPSDK